MHRIIDADVHISPTPQQGCSITAEELIECMDKCGVSRAVTWIHPPYERGQLEQTQKYLYDSWKRFPDRILGFGWADPSLGIQRAIDTVKKCTQEYGFYGVKLNGAQNNFLIDDPSFDPVIAEIAKSGKLAAFHIGADDYENTHPYRLMKIAKRYSDTRFIMVHMGGASLQDLSHAAIEVAQECPNITVVASSIRTRSFYKGVMALGADRVCFGSDAPFEVMRAEVARTIALFKGEISDSDLDKLMYGTAAALYNVE